jgi:probable F420-dependent oxidoreductase
MVRQELLLGVTMMATDRTIAVVDLAREAEARGFHSLYLPEHTHIPVSRATPPPTGEAELAEEYLRLPDPFVALAAAAAVTSRLLLGTGVALVAQHDPIALAKQVATVDHLSGGRFVLGVGFGWNREEMADHGVAYAERRAVVREHVLAMQALWSQEVASFEGEHVRLSPSWQWPKPVQQPRVRTPVGGGAGPVLFSHVAEWADGWIPIGGAGIKQALPALHEALASVGRSPESVEIVPFGTLPTEEKLEHYRTLGVREVVLRLPPADLDTTRRRLDDYARFLPP